LRPAELSPEECSASAASQYRTATLEGARPTALSARGSANAVEKVACDPAFLGDVATFLNAAVAASEMTKQSILALAASEARVEITAS
jgi:hypothetical protein